MHIRDLASFLHVCVLFSLVFFAREVYAIDANSTESSLSYDRFYSFSHNVQGKVYTIYAKVQPGIEILNSTIVSGSGIYLDLRVIDTAQIELTLPKDLVGEVVAIEHSISDYMAALPFEIVSQNQTHNIIMLTVPLETRNIVIRGVGGIVPEFGTLPVLIPGMILVITIVLGIRIRKLS